MCLHEGRKSLYMLTCGRKSLYMLTCGRKSLYVLTRGPKALYVLCGPSISICPYMWVVNLCMCLHVDRKSLNNSVCVLICRS